MPPVWALPNQPGSWDAAALGAVATMLREELRWQGLLPK